MTHTRTTARHYRLPVAALAAMTVVSILFVRSVARALEEGSASSTPSAAEATAPDPNAEKLNAEIKSKRDRAAEIKKAIEVREREIAEKRQQSATLKNQIGILENRVSKTELDIQEAEAELQATELEIQGLERAISGRQQQIDTHKAYVAEYLRTIYRYDDRSYLEVLLVNDRFSDFFDAIASLENVEGALSRRVLELKDEKTALDTQKSSHEEKRNALGELRERLATAKERLSEEQSGKQALAIAVQQSEQELRRAVGELKAEQQGINRDIISLENSLRKKLTENKRFNALPSAPGRLGWPVDPSRGITTYFHDPDYPFRYVYEHPGLDIRAYQGIPVRAASSGVVGRAKNGGARGYSYIMIVHPGGLSTVYGHVSKILVVEDQFVEAGDIIALSGGAPGTPGAGSLTTGPHMHFEVRLNGIPVNPLEYLGGR